MKALTAAVDGCSSKRLCTRLTHGSPEVASSPHELRLEAGAADFANRTRVEMAAYGLRSRLRIASAALQKNLPCLCNIYVDTSTIHPSLAIVPARCPLI